MIPHAWCPPGYTPISQIADTLRAWLVDGAKFSEFPDEKANTFRPRLEHALAWDELPSAGVCVRSGDFAAIPAKSWRLEIPWREYPMPPLDRALNGLTVMVDWYFGPEVHAVVALSNLAGWLGASFLPEPPTVLPATKEAAAPKRTQPAKDAVPSRKSGPPPQYDWVAFGAEIVRIANSRDGLPDDNTLRSQMWKWCESTFGKEPSDSLVRDHLAKFTAQVRNRNT